VFRNKSGLALSLGAVAAGVRNGEAKRQQAATTPNPTTAGTVLRPLRAHPVGWRLGRGGHLSQEGKTMSAEMTELGGIRLAGPAGFTKYLAERGRALLDRLLAGDGIDIGAAGAGGSRPGIRLDR
jgi:hypothetical protein